jgi:hypothetical protein
MVPSTSHEVFVAKKRSSAAAKGEIGRRDDSLIATPFPAFGFIITLAGRRLIGPAGQGR